MLRYWLDTGIGSCVDHLEHHTPNGLIRRGHDVCYPISTLVERRVNASR